LFIISSVEVERIITKAIANMSNISVDGVVGGKFHQSLKVKNESISSQILSLALSMISVSFWYDTSSTE
jgi:hypothetical protein